MELDGLLLSCYIIPFIIRQQHELPFFTLSLVIEPLLVVEEEVPLAVEHLLDGGGHDLVVVAAVPAVPVLPDVGGVVAGLDVADVVDHSEQRVAVVSVRGVVSDCREGWREVKCYMSKADFVP